MAMGIELELFVLLALTTFGMIWFGKFEIETPRWRRMLKWTIVDGMTLGLYFAVGHWALAVPLLLGLAGTAFHFVWCRRNGIDPLQASPRTRYYELRGWEEWA